MSTKPIPSVALPAEQKDNRQLIETEAIKALTAQAPLYDLQTVIRKCQKRLSRYSDDTLAQITAAASTNLHQELLQKIAYESPHEEFIRDWIMFEPVARNHQLGTIDPLIYGLEHFPEMASQSDPIRRLEQGTSIISVTKWMSLQGPNVVTSYTTMTSYGGKERIQYIGDERIRTLLTTHDNPGAVADAIIDRGLTDAVEISELADAMSKSIPALREGSL